MFLLTRKNFFIILLFILLAVFYYTLFYHINLTHFDSWDESRHAVSSIEMNINKNWIINTWMNKNDMWNLKPILSFLPTCIIISLFGKSILTVRLFSIVSTILLCSIVCYYTYKKYNIISSILFLSLLFTASLIIKTHGFRSGDADAFYIFCQVMVVIALASKNDTRHITLAAFFSALAFLTKSWHALFMAIPYFIAYGYLFKNKQLSIKSFTFPIIVFFSPILIWLALRYPYDKFDFIKEMYRYDLIARASDRITGHYHSIWYFFNQLVDHFSLITIIFIFALIYSFSFRKWKMFSYDILIILSAILSSFLIFSLAKTRLAHYSYTHIILICIISAILIGRDVNYYTKLLTLLLAIIALIYNMNTLHQFSKNKLPAYYDQLQKNAFPLTSAIFTPHEITQAERLSFMVMGNFNNDTIKQGKPVKNSLAYYRVGAKDNPDVTGCRILTEEKTLNDIRYEDDTVRLYTCQEDQ